MKDEIRRFQDDVPAHVAGKLARDRARRLEAWLSRDPEHRELVDDWGRIARGLREGAAVLQTACPDATLLAAWARGERSDPTGDVARHLDSCASCSLEVETVRRSRPRAEANPPKAPRQKAYRIASFAAAAGLLLGLALGLLLDRPPGLPGRVVSPDGAWSGAVELLQLDPSLRGDTSPVSYVTAPGQTMIPMVVAPVLPEDALGQDRFQFEILVAGGGGVWSSELTAAAIQSRLDTSGFLSFLVPARVLPPGRYALRFARVSSSSSDAGEAPLLRVAFAIE